MQPSLNQYQNTQFNSVNVKNNKQKPAQFDNTVSSAPQVLCTERLLFLKCIRKRRIVITILLKMFSFILWYKTLILLFILQFVLKLLDIKVCDNCYHVVYYFVCGLTLDYRRITAYFRVFNKHLYHVKRYIWFHFVRFRFVGLPYFGDIYI